MVSLSSKNRSLVFFMRALICIFWYTGPISGDGKHEAVDVDTPLHVGSDIRSTLALHGNEARELNGKHAYVDTPLHFSSDILHYYYSIWKLNTIVSGLALFQKKLFLVFFMHSFAETHIL